MDPRQHQGRLETGGARQRDVERNLVGLQQLKPLQGFDVPPFATR
jgi:hypothetical protein